MELGSRVDATASGRLMSRGQRRRTMALLVGWPATIGFGMLFGAWWKVMALAVGAFLVLVPLLGALTPRAQAEHYVAQIPTTCASGARTAIATRTSCAGSSRITAQPPT